MADKDRELTGTFETLTCKILGVQHLEFLLDLMEHIMQAASHGRRDRAVL